MENTHIRENIERNRIKANIFLKDNSKVFIIDTSKNYYFCYVTSVGENYIYIKNFRGKRTEIEEKILFVDMIKFEEYKENGN